VRRWWNWEEFLEQRSEVGEQRSEVGGQRSEERPRSGEMFIATEPTNDAIRSPQNAAHFVESGKDSNGVAESINMSRLRRDEVSDKLQFVEQPGAENSALDKLKFVGHQSFKEHQHNIE